ncbi:MAG: uncharacterized protein JWN46_576, partial [Acidimicrobiales bacterium]|nr:uncharacterized protein [Acidimicrobiales bacterium]
GVGAAARTPGRHRYGRRVEPGVVTNVPPRASIHGPDELLRRLDLAVAHKLDGMLHGEYQGLVPGQGSELGETRRYQPGDDVRHIDWNVTARMRDPHVRETIADRELESWVVVDLAPSLEFGTALCEKRDLAVSAAAAVGFLTARTGNRIGAVLVTPDGTRTVPPLGGRLHLMAMLHQVITSPRDQSGTTDLGAAIGRLSVASRRRGLCVVISDFLSDPDEWEQPLRRLSTRHEVIAIEIIDPRELELPDVGVLTLVDTTTGERRDVPTASRKLRDRYAVAAAAQRQRTADALLAARADHLVLRTDRDWLLDIVRFVTSRRARVAARRVDLEAR